MFISCMVSIERYLNILRKIIETTNYGWLSADAKFNFPARLALMSNGENFIVVGHYAGLFCTPIVEENAVILETLSQVRNFLQLLTQSC